MVFSSFEEPQARADDELTPIELPPLALILGCELVKEYVDDGRIVVKRAIFGKT
jgi:hypothetical protein